MISGNSRILVQELGYIPVYEVPNGNQVIWDGEGLIQGTVTKCSPQTLFNIELTNGKSIHATAEQEFQTLQKRLDGKAWTSTSALTKNHLIYFTSRTFDFDYLDKSEYTYLSKLNSEQLGMLVGLVHCLQGEVLDIPKIRKEAIETLETLLNLTQTEWTKEEYFYRTERLKYKLSDDLKEELKNFQITNVLPDMFWTSKVFMRGFLKSLFTFGLIGTEMFTVRAHRESQYLKEIQDYLGLFGINSSYSKGLRASQLIIFKNNCYRFANDIGVFNPEILLPGVDFKKVLVYKDSTLSDMRYGSVQRVEKIGDSIVYEIKAESYMANGLVLRKI